MSARIIGHLICLIILFVSGLKAQDLKVQDVISKHIASIGTVEKRKELKNMMLLGFSQFESTLPQRKSAGKLAIVSNSSNLLFISSFLSESYPFEKIGFFEGKITVPFVTPGIRSPLGDFLFEHPSLLNKGFFTGSMSLNWSLLENNQSRSKFRFAGTKKLDGRKTYVIECFTEGTSEDFKIRLFFDSETFQHLRSEYREEFAGKEVPFSGRNPANSTLGQINGYVMELTESFSDFKTYEDITLPSTMKVHYSGSSSKGAYEYSWTFKVGDVKFNQTLKEDFFTF